MFFTSSPNYLLYILNIRSDNVIEFVFCKSIIPAAVLLVAEQRFL